MKKEIKITMSPNIVHAKLEAMFKLAGETNAELIARMIVDNLATTEMGMGQLIFAFMGIEEKIPWLVGDTCLVHPNYISSWDCDKEGMIKKGFNMHNGHFIATITDIDMRVERNIKFKFKGYSIDNTTKKEIYKNMTGSCPASELKLAIGLPPTSEISGEKRENVADIL